MKIIFNRNFYLKVIEKLLVGILTLILYIPPTFSQRASPDDIYGTPEYSGGGGSGDFFSLMLFFGACFLIYCFFKVKELRKYIVVFVITVAIVYNIGSSMLGKKNDAISLIVICGVLWFGFKLLREMFSNDADEARERERKVVQERHRILEENKKSQSDSAQFKSTINHGGVESTKINKPQDIPKYVIPLVVTNNRLKTTRPLKPDASPNVRSLHSAATQGHAEEQFDLAQRYQKADGIDENYLEAAFWYLLAAKQGHREARNNLGILFKNGMGVWRNEEISAQLLADAQIPDFEKIAQIIADEQALEARWNTPKK